MNYINQENSTRILAIDYGDSKVGFAISDLMKIIAKPYKTIKNISQASVIHNIKEIIFDKSIEKIVIGLPKTLKNTSSQQTKKVEAFSDKLETKIDIPLIRYDERLSSIEAKRSLVYQGIKTGHNKEYIDMTAAAIFLQSYLNEKSNTK